VAGDGGDDGFVRPRSVIAFLLASLLAVLLTVDAASPEYQMSEVTLTLLLGGILTLVGIEAADIIRGGKG